MILSYSSFIMFPDTDTYVCLSIFHLYYTSIEKGLEVLNCLDALKYFTVLLVHYFMINSCFGTLERGEKKECSHLFISHIEEVRDCTNRVKL